MKRAEPPRRRRIVAMTAAAALAVAGALAAALADPPLKTSSLQTTPSASLGQTAIGRICGLDDERERHPRQGLAHLRGLLRRQILLGENRDLELDLVLPGLQPGRRADRLGVLGVAPIHQKLD